MKTQHKIRIWDVPTRLFHWLLVLAVGGLWYTGDQQMMDIHFLLGFTVLGLLLFRFAWGLVGGRYSRFGALQLAPKTSIAYVKNGLHSNYQGHNPLGSWGVVVLLLCLSTQVVTGLFANDGIFYEGPLAYLVSGRTSGLLTDIHGWNFNILLGLIGCHIVAVLFHGLVRKEGLVHTMMTGYRKVTSIEPEQNEKVAIYGSWKVFAVIATPVILLVIWLSYRF